jgi:hypothetical protein
MPFPPTAKFQTMTLREICQSKWRAKGQKHRLPISSVTWTPPREANLREASSRNTDGGMVIHRAPREVEASATPTPRQVGEPADRVHGIAADHDSFNADSIHAEGHAQLQRPYLAARFRRHIGASKCQSAAAACLGLRCAPSGRLHRSERRSGLMMYAAIFFLRRVNKSSTRPNADARQFCYDAAKVMIRIGHRVSSRDSRRSAPVAASSCTRGELSIRILECY